MWYEPQLRSLSQLRYLSAACLVVAANLGLILPAAADPLLLIRVAKAEAVFDGHRGEKILAVELTSESGKVLAELTGSHIGKKIAISLEGKVLASPFIYEAIIGGAFWLSPFDQNDLDSIVKRLSEEGAALQVEVRPDL
jgi:hypothetical protein